ncbi:FAD/NAD(P)-binding domain-containing protein [Aspergillus germanicus]
MSARLAQITGHMAAPERTGSAYKVTETPLGSTRHLRIVGIGAGMSGINMIRTLRLHVKDYEQDANVTFHPTTQFSWRPNPEWTGFFSPAPEIQEYLCRVCDEEGMRDVIKTSHQVTRAERNDAAGSWDLEVHDLDKNIKFHDYCHFLLDGSGILNHWKWPEIPGLHSFQGRLIHSADWPSNFDYTGMTVAVVGNGSSGVQILPEMQRGEPLEGPYSNPNAKYIAIADVKNLVHFVREPTWVVPSRLQLLAQGAGGGVLSQVSMDENSDFTKAQIERFKSDPIFYRRFVKAVEEVVNGNFPLTLKNTEFAATLQKKAVEYMTEALDGDERLDESHREGYSPGLATSAGELIQVDAIICATGFNVSFCPRFPIIGPQGNLQDTWTKQLPNAYMSCAIPGFPNYFTFLGPNAPIRHGSVFTITEHIAKYLTRIIKKCRTEGIKAISPSQAAVDELYEHTQSFMPRTAWTANCISWFKNGTADGPVTALHPGSRIHFFHMLEEFRGEDWEYLYINRRNRFQYLGNGFSTKEDGGEDSTWYLDDPDKL